MVPAGGSCPSYREALNRRLRFARSVARHDQRRTGAQQQAGLARDEQAAHVRRGAFDAPAGIDVVPAEMLRTPDDAARGRLACLGVGGLTATLRQQVQRSEEHTSELQSHLNLVCRLLLEKKKRKHDKHRPTQTRRTPPQATETS